MSNRLQYATIAGLCGADCGELVNLAQTSALFVLTGVVVYAFVLMRREMKGAADALRQVIEEQRAMRADQADMKTRLAKLENGR